MAEEEGEEREQNCHNNRKQRDGPKGLRHHSIKLLGRHCDQDVSDLFKAVAKRQHNLHPVRSFPDFKFFRRVGALGGQQLHSGVAGAENDLARIVDDAETRN